MDNVEEIHRQMGDSLMSNQCPLCSYVMSTRKSFRHHLIFQHVLRDKGALNVLLGTKTQSFPVVNPVNEISKGRLKKPKREKVEIREDATAVHQSKSLSEKNVVKKEAGTLEKCGASKKLFAIDLIKVEIIENGAKDLCVDEEPWMKLKTLLSKKCLEKRNSADCTPFKCKICGEVYMRQFTFEVHLAEKHLNVALEETA